MKNTEDENGTQPEELFTKKQVDYVYQNRRYIGSKETFGYVVWSAAQSFNINAYSERYINTIVQISFKYQQVLSVFAGIWDIINDVFVAAIVDKTRTR